VFIELVLLVKKFHYCARHKVPKGYWLLLMWVTSKHIKGTEQTPGLFKSSEFLFYFLFNIVMTKRRRLWKQATPGW